MDRELLELSPWLPGDIKPVRAGMYRAQDRAMRCDCCWIELHWDGRDWHSNLYSPPGRFTTLCFAGDVKRWRGLAAAAEIGKSMPGSGA